MSVQNIIQTMIAGEPVEGVKNFTVRLSYTEASQLAALAKCLNVTASGLLKTLSLAALKEGSETYLSCCSPDDEQNYNDIFNLAYEELMGASL